MVGHPTVADMIKHPYGVLSHYTDLDGKSRSGDYASEVTNQIPTFDVQTGILLEDVLRRASQNERAKEIVYIDTFFESIDNLKDYKFYNDMKALYDQLKTPLENKSEIKTVSKIVDAIQKVKTGLYDLDKTLDENEKIFKEFNKLAATNPISKTLREVLQVSGALNAPIFGKLDPKSTGNTLIEEALNNYTNMIEKAIKNNDFNEKQIAVLYDLVKTYRVKLKEFYENKLSSVTTDPLNRSLEDLEQDIKKHDSMTKDIRKQIATTKKGNPKSIEQVVWDTINGSLGGKGIEYTIDLSGGGKNTGNILNSSGLSIDADNIQLASGKLTYYYSASDDLFTQNNQNIYFEDFKRDLQNIEEMERKFIIMTSAKDQSTNASFKDYSGGQVKIKGDATLESRRTEIEKMFEIANVGYSPNELVFGIANLGTDFVCNGQVENAKQALAALCIGWMFDDVKEIIIGEKFLGVSDSLHFYNLNGKYYTLSDILELTAQNIQNKLSGSDKRKNYVNIGITVPKNPYEKILAENSSPNEEMDRWEAVSSSLMSNTKINVHMNVNNLFKDLFNI